MAFYSGYYCDKCGVATEYRRTSDKWLPSKTHLVRWARESGWSIGKQVLCPNCRKKARKSDER